jgi:REP element-mobilizing transposase RayT
VNDKLTSRVHEVLNRQWEPVYRSCLHYLVSWSTRGRKPVLRDRHILKLRELVPALADERGIEVLEVAPSRDGLRLLIGLKPTHSVATAVREIKGRAGLEMLTLFPELRVWLGGNLLWDDRYSVETVSAARVEQLRESLRSDRGDRGDRDDPGDPKEPFARAS